jgi:hypothetical protein
MISKNDKKSKQQKNAYEIFVGEKENEYKRLKKDRVTMLKMHKTQ